MPVYELKPKHWFKTIEEIGQLYLQPESIEYLKMPSGETYIHCGGTAFWHNGEWNMESLKISGITHWRVINDPRNYLK